MGLQPTLQKLENIVVLLYHPVLSLLEVKFLFTLQQMIDLTMLDLNWSINQRVSYFYTDQSILTFKPFWPSGLC